MRGLRKQQADDRSALNTAQRRSRPGGLGRGLAAALKAAEQRTGDAKDAVKAAAPAIQKIRFLDQTVAPDKGGGGRGRGLCQGGRSD